MPARSHVFLSHIDEERDLALLLKDTVEAEFSGFVEVFSFSDADMNPAGGNIIRTLERNLLTTTSGVFLVSSASLARPWINFELGALWMCQIVHKEQDPILIIPFCHSGAAIDTLPMPIAELNAITATDSKHLRNAFASLQRVVGGSGSLRTNFSSLAGQIQSLEGRYMIGNAFKKFWASLVNKPFPAVVRELDLAVQGKSSVTCRISDIEQSKLDIAIQIACQYFGGAVKIVVKSSAQNFTDHGLINTAKAEVAFSAEFYRSIRDSLQAEMEGDG